MTANQLFVFLSVSGVLCLWVVTAAVSIFTADDAPMAVSRVLRSVAVPALGLSVIAFARPAAQGWLVLLPNLVVLALALVVDRRVRSRASALLEAEAALAPTREPRMVFARSPLMPALSFVLAAGAAVSAVLQLAWVGSLGLFGIWLLIAAASCVVAGSRMTPLAIVTPEAITLKVAPLRGARVIPWAAISQARLSRTGNLELAVADGEPVTVRLGAGEIARVQRDALIAEVENRVGTISRSA